MLERNKITKNALDKLKKKKVNTKFVQFLPKTRAICSVPLCFLPCDRVTELPPECEHTILEGDKEAWQAS